ncbi:deoxyguanosinetriphosphate triphosphohydrolase [Thermomonospora catenispora]|uniref:deoxyguanosinetriphosphate triphosphohydrolase n=1 Tax=Thermomonospora catenispora TaxID=2493090 RepID=UPI00111E134E|nr:deoxyguanosinetriphosphate triphosphohydrolase [Thermomonospora catenispora]TNY35746.1 deoxyguanosinetriphosphate triphosphohydrolase [Thermomonospora catenispora]
MNDHDYTDFDRARWAPEPPKRRDRTPFERDRARVLHSAALRRLAAKTQVATPGTDDFLRTRLTHSLECAQVGRELGKSLGCDPDVVETACLAHDIGHPPFGHNGEAALDVVARPCGGFEGNAQSLRILTRLEPKSFAPDGRSVGLNLTRASLDAVMKYPWRKADRPPDAPLGGSGGPYGVYEEDADAAAWVRQGAPGRRLCLEAQVMDWSDDVAYSVHDLEDALVAGHVDFARLADPTERRAVARTARRLYCPDVDLAELEEVFAELMAEPYWPDRYDGGPRTLAALKNLTSTLIGRFCLAAEQATRARYGPGRLTRYAADLIVPRRQRLECALLKGVTAHYVWISHRAVRARQRELIMELAELVAAGAPATLEVQFQEAWREADDDAARWRVIVDQIASLTDTSAIALHRRLRAAA